MFRRRIVWLRVAVASMLGFLGVVGLGTFGMYRWVTRAEQRYNDLEVRFLAEMEIHFERFIADLRVLAAHPVTALGPRENDASTVLFEVVRRESADGLQVIDDGIGLLSDVMREAAHDKGWLNTYAGVDLAGVDTGWMATLAGFDHWDSPTIPEGLPRDEILDRSMRSLDLNSLRAWVRLRWLRSLTVGDDDAAQRETRDLTRLVLRSNWYRAAGVALFFMQQEIQFHAHLRQLGREPQWEPYDLAFVESFSNVWQKYPIYLSMFSPDAMWRRVSDATTWNAMSCSVLTSTVVSQSDVVRILYLTEAQMRYRSLATELDSYCRSKRFLPLLESLAAPPRRAPFPLGNYIWRYQMAAVRFNLLRNLVNNFKGFKF